MDRNGEGETFRKFVDDAGWVAAAKTGFVLAMIGLPLAALDLGVGIHVRGEWWGGSIFFALLFHPMLGIYLGALRFLPDAFGEHKVKAYELGIYIAIVPTLALTIAYVLL